MTECTNTSLGIIPPPPGHMEVIRDNCTKYGVLMVVDEIITGIAKTGAWFESEKYGIVPDTVCIGKAISAGCGVLAATHMREEIGKVIMGTAALHHGFTYAGLGYLAAAGLAALAYVEEHGLVARTREIGYIAGTRLRALASKSPVVGDVRINGAIRGVELVRDKKTKAKSDDAPAVAALVNEVGREHGVLLNCPFPQFGNIIAMYLPLTSKDAELATVCDTIEDAARRVENTYV